MSDPTGDTLPWPSAFWAVIGIAATTMTQPSGMIMGAPSRMNFALRSSPIICAMNALGSIVVLGFAIKATSLRCALRAFRTSRFADASAGSYQDFCSNSWVRLILIVISLTQIIKLYATEGIPWVQALASIYLAAYIVDEAILLASASVPEASVAENRADAAAWAATPILATLLRVSRNEVSRPWVHGVRAQARDSEKGIRLRTAGFRLGIYWSTSITFCFNLLAVLQKFESYAGNYVKEHDEMPRLGPLIFFLGGLPSSCVFGAIMMASEPSSDGYDWFTRTNYPFSQSTAYMVTSLAGTCLTFAGIVSDTWAWLIPGTVLNIVHSVLIMVPKPPAMEKQEPPFKAGWRFLLLHVLGIALYLPTAYDESVTWRPAWTDYLG